MPIRRLAEPGVQPPSFAFSGVNGVWAEATIRKYPEGRQQSAVIPLLMRAQEQEGWVTKAAIEAIADMLSMPYIRALEVATFYTQFQLKPVGSRAHVQVCGTTPCMLRGSEELMQVCRSRIHPEQFHLSPDGTLSWEEVECLGACVNAPMAMIFKDTYEDLSPERLTQIIEAFQRGEGDSVVPGTQMDRFNSAPAGGLTSLRDETPILEAEEQRQPALDANSNPAAGGSVPPTRAGRPTTAAAETSAAFISPSESKTIGEPGPGQSPIAPPVDEAAANRPEPAVEGEKRQRRARKAVDQSPDKAPELLKGEPIGPAGKRPSRRKAPVGAPSPEGGNMTQGGTPTDKGEGEV